MNNVVIKVTDVLNHLENGVARTKTARNYNPEIGSIEEIYNLQPTEVTELFKHPDLKGKKTKTPSRLVIVGVNDEDTNTTDEGTDPTSLDLRLQENDSQLEEEVLEVTESNY